MAPSPFKASIDLLLSIFVNSFRKRIEFLEGEAIELRDVAQAAHTHAASLDSDLALAKKESTSAADARVSSLMRSNALALALLRDLGEVDERSNEVSGGVDDDFSAHDVETLVQLHMVRLTRVRDRATALYSERNKFRAQVRKLEQQNSGSTEAVAVSNGTWDDQVERCASSSFRKNESL